MGSPTNGQPGFGSVNLQELVVPIAKLSVLHVILPGGISPSLGSRHQADLSAGGTLFWYSKLISGMGGREGVSIPEGAVQSYHRCSERMVSTHSCATLMGTASRSFNSSVCQRSNGRRTRQNCGFSPLAEKLFAF